MCSWSLYYLKLFLITIVLYFPLLKQVECIDAVFADLCRIIFIVEDLNFFILFQYFSDLILFVVFIYLNYIY